MNEKKNEKKAEAVTLNGATIHGVGIHAITRKGNLATESLGFGVALMVEGENGRTRLRLLADLLKGCRSLEGAAYEKYTAEAWTEARALVLASDFSAATGVPLLPKDAEAVKALKDKAEAAKAEAAKNGEKGEKVAKGEKKAPKTSAQKIADVVNKLPESEKIGALIVCLETLNASAAAAARMVLAGQGINEAQANALKAEAEAEEARKRAEAASRKA